MTYCGFGRRVSLLLLQRNQTADKSMCSFFVWSDVPAAHKLGGFGSHSHTLFCPHCWIAISNKQELTALTANGMCLSLLLFMSLTDYFQVFVYEVMLNTCHDQVT